MVNFIKYFYSFLLNKNNIWDKYFYISLLLILFLPPIVYIIYTLGIPLIYHQLNVVLLLNVILGSILYLLINKRDKVLLVIPLTIGIVFILNYFGSLSNVFTNNDLISFVGLFISITAAPFFSIFIIKHYRRYGNINILYYFIFISGILISTINITMFILLYYGDYTVIFSYTEFLGLGGYINDLGSLFVRPAGYFFDYHSQYYIPLITYFMVYTNKILLKPKIRFLILSLTFTAIIISGIKSAYLTIIICFIYLLFRRINLFYIIYYFIIIFFLFIITDYFLDSIMFELGYKILTHDINIFIEHFTEVPIILFEKFSSVFYLGGQVDFQNYVYSEVYYVTLIYYVGIFGVLIITIYPTIFLLIISKDKFVILIVLVFSLSLIHYYVYKISINVIGSALYYFYFFLYLFFKPKNAV